MIDFAAEIKHQEEQLKNLVNDIRQKLELQHKITGALEMLRLLEQQAKVEETKVVEEVKAVEAEVIEEVKKVI